MKEAKRNPVAEVFTYAKDKKKAVFSVVFATISVFGGLIPYLSAATIVTRVIEQNLKTADLIFWGLCAIAGYTVKSFCSTLASSCSHKMAYSILAEIRTILTDKLLRVSLGNAAKKSAGEYKQILMDEVEHLEYPLAHMLPELTSHILGFLVMITVMFFCSLPLALASLGTLVLGFLIYGFMMAGKDVKKMFESYTKDSETMVGAMVEYVSGIEVIKAFGQTASSMEKFKTAVLAFRDSMKQWFAHCYSYLAGFYVVTPNSLLLVMPVGALLMAAGVIPFNKFMICMFLAFGISEPIIKMMEFTDHIMAIATTMGKVDELLSMEDLPEGTMKLSDIETIEAKEVRFGYTKDQCVIDGVSFSIKAGERVAFVGNSGSGKSTLAKLLVRFYDPDSGSIRIGNPSASDQEMIAAAKKAACNEFIQALPDGYETGVGEAGGRLSGGQRQRIAIARTILKDAPIVILDEASAFIDPENEDKIQRSIEALTEGKTLIMIAHRLHTIVNCDRIFVVNDGRIVAEGTHDGLLRSCAAYQKLWEHNKEEVG